jgi:hypothetical protein
MYDCHDLLSGFHDICSEIVTAEATVFESADLVRFSSPWLDVAAIRPCEKNRSSSEMASIRLIDPSLSAPANLLSATPDHSISGLTWRLFVGPLYTELSPVESRARGE